MAEIVWTEPALADLDAVADYIALDNPSAARLLVQNVFAHLDQLEAHPDSGSFPQDLSGKRYRQIVEPPCRVIYRYARNEEIVYVLHVMRSEQKLRRSKLRRVEQGER
jgi:plasmid stabilization system protein ParE